MKKRIASALLAIMILLTCSAVSYADEITDNYDLEKTAIEFLEEHGIDQDIFKNAVKTDMTCFQSSMRTRMDALTDPGSYNSAVMAIKDQAEAYNFTDEQIQELIQGLVDTPTKAVGGTSKNEEISLFAINRPNDDGVGYEVQSNSGYYQTTTFAQVPSVYRGTNDGASGYMFWTVNNMDVGIWYSNGNDGKGWRFFWNYGSGNDCVSKPESGLYAGRDIYFYAWVVDNNWVRVKVVDANNFNNVICDYSVSTSGRNITKTNASWNRQITLCANNAAFNNSAYLRNAEFSNAYIYKTNGTYSQTNASNCVSNRLGSFGTNNTTKKLVTVNDSTPWYMENVSINF